MPEGVKATPQWKVVSAAWDFAAPLAQSGQSTTAQRADFDKKFAAAKSALAELVKAGTFSAAEGSLMETEAQTIRDQVLRNPPTDVKMLCYEMAVFLPAQESLDRLALRLPLLKTVAQAGRASPAVIEKVLPAIRDDVERLSSEAQLKSLPPGDQDKARQLAAQARQTLADIEKACAQ